MFNKKLILGLFVFVLVASVVAADFGVEGLGTYDITYPEGWYNIHLAYFTWEGSSGADVIINSCSYKLNDDMYEMIDCNPGNYNFFSSLSDDSYSLLLYLNYSFSSDPDTSYFPAVDASSFNIDFIPPEIDITYPIAQDYGNVITSLEYTLTETNLDSCWYSIDNGFINISTICINGANSIPISSQEGDNTWIIWAKDIVNHISKDSVNFWVDSIFPEINFINPTTESGAYSQDYIIINLTCVDTNKYLINLNLNGIDEGFDNNLGDIYWKTKTLLDGVYDFYASCADTIGHLSTTETRIVTLDTTPPP